MKPFLRLLIIVPMLLASFVGRAQGICFEADGFTYEIISVSEMTCALVDADERIKKLDDIIMPGTVSFRGKDLKVVRIGAWAFEDCNARTIRIGENIREIDERAFPSCDHVFAVFVPKTCGPAVNALLESFDDDFLYVKDATGTLYLGRSESEYDFQQDGIKYKVPANTGPIVLEVIGPAAANFYGHIVIPDEATLLGMKVPVSRIAEKAFYKSKLQELTIGKNIKEIGDKAFCDASSLIRINFSEGLEYIGDQAFYNTAYSQYNLTISLPSSCKELGYDVFGYDSSPGPRMLVLHQSPQFKNREIASPSLHLGASFLTSDLYEFESSGICFADDVTAVPARPAVRRPVVVPDVFIGTGVKSIGDLSGLEVKEGGCIYLKSAIPPTAVAFSENTYVLTTLKVPKGSVERYKNAPVWKKFWVIEEWDVKDHQAFWEGTRITVDGVPYSILSADDMTCAVMAGGTDFGRTIRIPGTVSFHGLEFSVAKIEKHAFYKSDIQTVIIGDNVKEIGEEAFAETPKLSSVTLGAGIETIGNRAFYNNPYTRYTRDICLPETCRSIGKDAFGDNRIIVVHGTPDYEIHDSARSLLDFTLHVGKHFLKADVYSLASAGISFADDVTRIPSCVRPSDKIKIPLLSIGSGATEIGDMSGLDIASIYVWREAPPRVTLFNYKTYLSAPLFVPMSSEGRYRAALGWKDFRVVNPPPPPEAPAIPVLSDQIDIVDDNIQIDDDRFLNLEDDDTAYEIAEYREEVVVEEEVEEEAIPFQLVEEKPSFMGGDANTFSRWVAEHIVYPEIAKENNIQGKVLTRFTIEKTGQVTNVVVVRPVDPVLDAEALRVIRSSPMWSPGKQRGRAMKVTYTFPVIFQLRDSTPKKNDSSQQSPTS